MLYKKIEIKVDGYEETVDLYTYILDNSVEMHPQKMRPVIVICPGGGYAMTSDREAEPIAMQYLAKGYHAVILRYSVAPAEISSGAYAACKDSVISEKTCGQTAY